MKRCTCGAYGPSYLHAHSCELYAPATGTLEPKRELPWEEGGPLSTIYDVLRKLIDDSPWTADDRRRASMDACPECATVPVTRKRSETERRIEQLERENARLDRLIAPAIEEEKKKETVET